jgi:predicted nucleic acid-binding protein
LILADTSLWVDHLRANDPDMAAALSGGMVLGHPLVVGEIALGHLPRRRITLNALAELPQATLASNAEVMQFIEFHALWGSGIGFVDAHLLASTRLTPDAALWTRDRRLHRVAAELRLARS